MKPAARKGDHHACADYGPNMGAQLLVEEGSPNISINGKPAARAGDAVSCRLVMGENPVITEGSASVFFNGRPAARMGDRIEKGGSVSSGSGNVFIGDSGTRVAVGDGIQVAFNDGCNIYLNCPSPADASFKSSLADALAMVEAGRQSMPVSPGGADKTVNGNTPNAAQLVGECDTPNKNLFNMLKCSAEVNLTPPPEKEEEAEKYTYYIVTSDGFKEKLTTFAWEDLSGMDVTQYFEEERWVESSNEGGVSKVGRAKLAGLSAAMALLPTFYTDGIRHDLIHRLELLNAQIKNRMPNDGGVLLQALYDAQSADGESTIVNLYDINIIASMTDTEYQPFIRKFMVEPGVSEESSSDLFGHMVHLFIWAVKE